MKRLAMIAMVAALCVPLAIPVNAAKTEIPAPTKLVLTGYEDQYRRPLVKVQWSYINNFSPTVFVVTRTPGSTTSGHSVSGRLRNFTDSLVEKNVTYTYRVIAAVLGRDGIIISESKPSAPASIIISS